MSRIEGDLPKAPCREGEQRPNRPSFKELFPGVAHPLIGMIHLPQLPGYNNETPSRETIDLLKKNALKDLGTLQTAGFDAIMVENNGDKHPARPYPNQRMPENVRFVYAEVMKAVALKARENSMKIGVHVSYDPETAIEVAHGLNADFVRIDIFANDMTNNDSGTLIRASGAKLIAYNQQLERQDSHHVYVVADAQVKHFTMVKPRSLEESVEATIAAGADTVVITGAATGVEADTTDVEKTVKTVHGRVPILMGSGINGENCSTFVGRELAYGAIIGSSIKTGPRIDYKKAAELVREAKKIL